MRDYSKYEKTPVLFSGAEKKFEIIIDGFRYIVKFQKNSEVGLTFNYVSEYLGSHIFQLLGIPVQETFLGTYEGKNVVVMKNFLGPEDDLVAFNGVGESSLERDKELADGVLAAAALIFRDALVCRCGGGTRISTSPETAQRLAAALTRAQLMRLAAAVEELQQARLRNVNYTLFLTLFCARLRAAAGK